MPDVREQLCIKDMKATVQYITQFFQSLLPRWLQYQEKKTPFEAQRSKPRNRQKQTNNKTFEEKIQMPSVQDGFQDSEKVVYGSAELEHRARTCFGRV
jgi:hypothetical protein